MVFTGFLLFLAVFERFCKVLDAFGGLWKSLEIIGNGIGCTFPHHHHSIQ